MSAIWNINLYKKLSKDEAECNECKKTTKTSGGSTSGLRTHLKQHSEYLKLFEKGLQKVDAISLDKFITVQGSGELSALDKQIIHFIACTNSSFNLINHQTFHALFSINHPLNKLKDEKHYRTWVLPRVYDSAKKAIRYQIDAADFLSFTSDIWSSSKTSDSFISLTCHWITQKWERKQCVIAMKPFPGQHTSANILRVFREILNEWGIPDGKCHVVLRDHASNITKVKIFNQSNQLMKCLMNPSQKRNFAIFFHRVHRNTKPKPQQNQHLKSIFRRWTSIWSWPFTEKCRFNFWTATPFYFGKNLKNSLFCWHQSHDGFCPARLLR